MKVLIALSANDNGSILCERFVRKQLSVVRFTVACVN
jgi:hypothetical protein